jgi:hypothetical protein
MISFREVDSTPVCLTPRLTSWVGCSWPLPGPTIRMPVRSPHEAGERAPRENRGLLTVPCWSQFPRPLLDSRVHHSRPYATQNTWAPRENLPQVSSRLRPLWPRQQPTEGRSHAHSSTAEPPNFGPHTTQGTELLERNPPGFSRLRPLSTTSRQWPRFPQGWRGSLHPSSLLGREHAASFSAPGFYSAISRPPLAPTSFTPRCPVQNESETTVSNRKVGSDHTP